MIFLGMLLMMIVLPVLAGLRDGKFPPLLAIIIPAIFAVPFYFMFKVTALDLVDGVWDDGDALIVRNGRLEDRIALTNIKNVSYTALLNPSRVTLSLRKPSKFGTKVMFCTPLRLIPFLRSPIVDELIDRIDAARKS